MEHQNLLPPISSLTPPNVNSINTNNLPPPIPIPLSSTSSSAKATSVVTTTMTSGTTPATQVRSDPTTPSGKRKQVKNACVNCQKACKKCDEERPCSRCVKYGIQDSCMDSVRKERKKGVKRGPYKRKSSKENYPEHMLAPAPPHLNRRGYEATSAYPFSALSSMAHHAFPYYLPRPYDRPFSNPTHMRNSQTSDDSAPGYYSDEEVYFSRKRAGSEDNKLGILANLCSAVLNHSRSNSPEKESVEETMSNSSNFDHQAIEALSAPIKSGSNRARSISEDTYYHSAHRFSKHQPHLQKKQSSDPSPFARDIFDVSCPKPPLHPSIPPAPKSAPILGQSTVDEANYSSHPITPPRSSGDVQSYLPAHYQNLQKQNIPSHVAIPPPPRTHPHPAFISSQQQSPQPLKLANILPINNAVSIPNLATKELSTSSPTGTTSSTAPLASMSSFPHLPSANNRAPVPLPITPVATSSAFKSTESARASASDDIAVMSHPSMITPARTPDVSSPKVETLSMIKVEDVSPINTPTTKPLSDIQPVDHPISTSH